MIARLFIHRLLTSLPVYCISIRSNMAEGGERRGGVGEQGGKGVKREGRRRRVRSYQISCMLYSHSLSFLDCNIVVTQTTADDKEIYKKNKDKINHYVSLIPLFSTY